MTTLKLKLDIINNILNNHPIDPLIFKNLEKFLKNYTSLYRSNQEHFDFVANFPFHDEFIPILLDNLPSIGIENLLYLHKENLNVVDLEFFWNKCSQNHIKYNIGEYLLHQDHSLEFEENFFLFISHSQPNFLKNKEYLFSTKIFKNPNNLLSIVAVQDNPWIIKIIAYHPQSFPELRISCLARLNQLNMQYIASNLNNLIILKNIQKIKKQLNLNNPIEFLANLLD